MDELVIASCSAATRANAVAAARPTPIRAAWLHAPLCRGPPRVTRSHHSFSGTPLNRRQRETLSNRPRRGRVTRHLRPPRVRRVGRPVWLRTPPVLREQRCNLHRGLPVARQVLHRPRRALRAVL